MSDAGSFSILHPTHSSITFLRSASISSHSIKRYPVTFIKWTHTHTQAETHTHSKIHKYGELGKQPSGSDFNACKRCQENEEIFVPHTESSISSLYIFIHYWMNWCITGRNYWNHLLEEMIYKVFHHFRGMKVQSFPDLTAETAKEGPHPRI